MHRVSSSWLNISIVSLKMYHKMGVRINKKKIKNWPPKGPNGARPCKIAHINKWVFLGYSTIQNFTPHEAVQEIPR